MTRKLIMVGVALLFLVSIGYLAFGILLYRTQESAIFPRPPVNRSRPYTFDTVHTYEELSLPADGAEISLVHFRTGSPRGVILFLHGNGDAIPTVFPVVAWLLDLGYDVVVPDYRSYGKSTGRIEGEQTLHDDMAVVYDYLQAHYAESDIILYGKSLGTGFATRLAAENDPRLVILESPFYSLQALVQRRIKLYPIRILKYHFRSDLMIGEIEAPIVVIHGDRDFVIPPEEGIRLYEEINSEKRLLILPGAGHESLIYRPEVEVLFTELLTD